MAAEQSFGPVRLRLGEPNQLDFVAQVRQPALGLFVPPDPAIRLDAVALLRRPVEKHSEPFLVLASQLKRVGAM